MPNTQSAMKATRQSARRHDQNQPVKSAARTYVRKARLAIADLATGAATMDEVQAAVQLAQRYLDSAASKGVLHKNNSSRRKSRLMLRLNKVAAASESA